MIFTAQSLAQTADATKATRDELQLNRRGQIADRFAKAVEQLGQEDEPGEPGRLSIRLGGIYALEQIMRDSADDERTIIEVLSAWVRMRTPASQGILPPESIPTSSPDVRAAITVLARRPRADQERNRFIDFTNTQVSLPNAQLDGANFEQVNVSHANLPYASLVGANLVGAYFTMTELSHAKLMRARLNQSYLAGASLVMADLSGADLSDAHINHANLGRANLTGATLRGAFLGNASLVGAEFSKAELDGAHFHNANLNAAFLCGVDLRKAEGLTTEQVRNSVMDAQTRLPEGVAKPVVDARASGPSCS